MNATSWIWSLLGWASLPLLAGLVLVFIYRRWVSEFPAFFSYVVVAFAVGIARLIGFSAPAKFVYVYWISDIVYSFFALMATWELFIKHLFPRFYKVRFYRYLFGIAALLIIVCSILVVLISGHLRVLNSIVYVYNFARAAILVFFVALMMLMGRRWTKLQFGIAAGFVLDVSASLASLGIWSHTPSWTVLIDRISVLAYDSACLIWIFCFLTAPKTAPAPLLDSIPTEQLHQARKWEEVLKDFLTSGKELV
jgi:hypothetical protein